MAEVQISGITPTLAALADGDYIPVDQDQGAGVSYVTKKYDVLPIVDAVSKKHTRSHSMNGADDHASMTADRIIGRVTTAGTPQELTAAEVKTLLGYAEISEADIDAGTGTTEKAITGRRAKYIQSIVPQNLKNEAYTLVLADAGKHLLTDNTTAYTWTIPANSSVAYPIGTAITFINGGTAGNITIAITTDTLRLVGDGTTGSKTLAPHGVATAIKVASTTWYISGTGIS